VVVMPVYISLSRMQKSHAPTKIEIYLSMWIKWKKWHFFFRKYISERKSLFQKWIKHP